jgi:hypothetical protein
LEAKALELGHGGNVRRQVLHEEVKETGMPIRVSVTRPEKEASKGN